MAADHDPREVLSSQAHWERARSEFSNASAYRDFLKLPVQSEESPTSHREGDRQGHSEGSGRWLRHRIFTEAFVDGATVDEVNGKAQEICADASGKPSRDADIFIALFNDFAILTAPEDE